MQRTHGDYDMKRDEDGTWTLTHWKTGETIVVPDGAARQLTSAVINRELRLAKAEKEQNDSPI
jgi:hypothetical protein